MYMYTACQEQGIGIYSYSDMVSSCLELMCGTGRELPNFQIQPGDVQVSLPYMSKPSTTILSFLPCFPFPVCRTAVFLTVQSGLFLFYFHADFPSCPEHVAKSEQAAEKKDGPFLTVPVLILVYKTGSPVEQKW